MHNLVRPWPGSVGTFTACQLNYDLPDVHILHTVLAYDVVLTGG